MAEKIFGEISSIRQKKEKKPLDLKKVAIGFLVVAIPFVIIFLLARQRDAAMLEAAKNATQNITYNFAQALNATTGP